MKKLSIIKIHGGKQRLVHWLKNYMPINYEKLIYIELYCGGSALLLNKLPSAHEIINDIHYGTYCALKIFRDYPEDVLDVFSKIDYNENVFFGHLTLSPKTELEHGIREIVL